MDKKQISLRKVLKHSSFPRILCGVKTYKKVEGDLLSINKNFLLFEHSIRKFKNVKTKNASSNKLENPSPRSLSIILPKNTTIKKNNVNNISNNNNIIKSKESLSSLFKINKEAIYKILKQDKKKIKLNLNDNSLCNLFSTKKNSNYFTLHLKKNTQKQFNMQKEKSNYSANTIEDLNTISTLNPMKKTNQFFLTKNSISSYDTIQKKFDNMTLTSSFTDIFGSKEKKLKKNNLSNVTAKNDYELKKTINSDSCRSFQGKQFLENSQKKEISNFIKYEYNLAKKYNSNVSKKLNLIKSNDNNDNVKTKIRYIFWKYQLPIIRKYYFDINAFKRKELELREENKTYYEKLDDIVEEIRKNRKNKNNSDENEEESEQINACSMENKYVCEEEEDILNKILKKRKIISSSLKDVYKRSKNQKKNHRIICDILSKTYRSVQKIKKSKSLIKYNK